LFKQRKMGAGVSVSGLPQPPAFSAEPSALLGRYSPAQGTRFRLADGATASSLSWRDLSRLMVQCEDEPLHETSQLCRDAMVGAIRNIMPYAQIGEQVAAAASASAAATEGGGGGSK